MARTTLTFRIDPELKEKFKSMVKQKGLSTCFILETLINAWIEGTKYASRGKVHDSPDITVNQEIRYVLKRRRRSVEEEIPETNFYDPKTNIWEYRSGPINDFGHALGCACLQCRKRGKI